MKKKSEQFDQYIFHGFEDVEDIEGTYEYLELLAPLIGYVAVEFNGLESGLNNCICQIFSDRSDATGLLVIHKMSYAAKVDMFKRFNDDLFRNVDYSISTYEKVIQELKECGRLRNIVVHAEWENTDNDGYTYVNLKISKEGMSQEYLQFSKESLIKIIQLISDTRSLLSSFWNERCEKLYGE